MSEPSRSSNKSRAWTTGSKSFNLVGSAASSVAKPASSFGEAIAGVASNELSDRHKVHDESLPGKSSETVSTPEVSGGHINNQGKGKGMLSNKLKTFKKGTNKVNPLRMVSAVKSQIQGSGNYRSSMLKQLGSDEAEDAVLSSVEKRFGCTTAGEDGFRPAGTTNISMYLSCGEVSAYSAWLTF